MMHAFDNDPRIATRHEREIGKAMKEMCRKEGQDPGKWWMFNGGYKGPVVSETVCQNVLKALAQGPMSLTQIRKRVKHGHPKVALAVNELVKRGAVSERRVQSTVRHYYAEYRLAGQREAAE